MLITDFAKLSNKDQNLIRKRIGKASESGICGRNVNRIGIDVLLFYFIANGNNNTSGKKGIKRAASVSPCTSARPQSDDFAVNRAETNKNLCVCCFKKIEKGAIEIEKIIHGTGQTDISVWYHLGCFTKHSSILGWYNPPDTMPGYKELESKDQAELKKKMG